MLYTLGPLIELPSVSNLEPWHGQSHVLSSLLKVKKHFKCGQTFETICLSPFSSKYIPTLLPFIFVITA